MNPSAEEGARLFLVCPASQLEPIIRQQYGQDSYFLTALASVFDFGETSYAEALIHFLDAAAVREIWIVQDLNCRFLQAVLSGGPTTGTQAESEVQVLYTTHYKRVMQPGSYRLQMYRLARLHVLQQAERLLANALVQRCMERNKIALRAMLCDTSTQVIETIDLRPEGICS